MTHGNQANAFLPLLGRVLERIIERGCLTIVDYRGRISQFGQPGEEPSATVRFHDRWLPLRIAFNPALATGEAYMDGQLTIASGDLRSFLDVAMGQKAQVPDATAVRMFRQMAGGVRRVLGGNNRRRAACNVEHHYDLPAEFYTLFLDSDMHYSCAYFPGGNETLEQAQRAKSRHIAAKLLLSSGQSVLDIGSGWGSLALRLATETQARVTAVTLSREQLETARKRSSMAGLEGSVDFALKDYRDVDGKFDRIVSVGMLEHVGMDHFGEYFDKVANLLDDRGVALIHSIGRWDADAGTDDFAERHIFPGGYIPSLSQMIPAIERSGLLVTDIEIVRLHYAETLLHWYERFTRNRGEALAMFGERFCRKWEFYLASAEMSFRHRGLMVVQVQLAHRRDAVPLTRDYIPSAERELAAKSERRPRRAA